MKAHNSKDLVASLIASAPAVEPGISFATTLFSSPQFRFLFFRAKRILSMQALGSLLLWLEYAFFSYWLEIPFVPTLIKLLAFVSLWYAFQWGTLEKTRNHFQELWNSGQRLKARKEMTNFLRQSIGFSLVPFLGIACLCCLDIFVFRRHWNFMHTLFVGVAIKAALQTWSRSVVSTFSVIRRTWQPPLFRFFVEVALLGLIALAADPLGDHVVGSYFALNGIVLAIVTYKNFTQTLRILHLPKSVIWSAKIKAPKDLSFLRRGLLGIGMNPDGLFVFVGSVLHPAVGSLLYLVTPVVRVIHGLSQSLYVELSSINYPSLAPLRWSFLRNWAWVFFIFFFPTISILYFTSPFLSFILLFALRMLWASFSVFFYLAFSRRPKSLRMQFAQAVHAPPPEPSWQWTRIHGLQTSLPQKERNDFEHALWKALLVWAIKGKRGRVRGYKVWLKSNDGVLLDEIVAWSQNREFRSEEPSGASN